MARNIVNPQPQFKYAVVAKSLKSLVSLVSNFPKIGESEELTKLCSNLGESLDLSRKLLQEELSIYVESI